MKNIASRHLGARTEILQQRRQERSQEITPEQHKKKYRKSLHLLLLLWLLLLHIINQTLAAHTLSLCVMKEREYAAGGNLSLSAAARIAREQITSCEIINHEAARTRSPEEYCFSNFCATTTC
jgi:hypothetical protein